ncbi:MAG: hypothetical protein ACRESS_01500 [Stenotrophobium sp.]
METRAFENIAAKLRRPAATLSALSGLSASELAQLEHAIDEACKHQREEVTVALRRALPQPLRSLILGKLAART